MHDISKAATTTTIAGIDIASHTTRFERVRAAMDSDARVYQCKTTICVLSAYFHIFSFFLFLVFHDL
jgi:trans-2-enoyl-CoA reductase